MPRGEKGRRGRGEGSIELLPDGRWRAILSLGVEMVDDPDRPGLRKEKRKRRKFYGKTKREALNKLREAQQQAAIGQLAGDVKLTLGQWADRWLELKQGSIQHGTWRRYRDVVETHLKPRLATVPLVKLATLHVEELYAAMKKGGVSGSEQRRAGNYLATIIRAGVRRGLCVRNPVGDVPKPKAEPVEFRVWSDEQVRAFLAAAVGSPQEALFWLAIDAGPRPGELYGLHWPQVDLERARVSFVQSLELDAAGSECKLKDTKTETGRRTVTITPATVGKLKEHRERQRTAGRDVQAGPVFTSGQGEFLRHRNFYNHYFMPILKRVSVPTIPPYSMRHTCAVLLLTAGVNIKVVSERLGHTSVRITLDHYARFMPGLQQMAAEKMQELLSPSCPPKGKGTGEGGKRKAI